MFFQAMKANDFSRKINAAKVSVYISNNTNKLFIV